MATVRQSSDFMRRIFVIADGAKEWLTVSLLVVATQLKLESLLDVVEVATKGFLGLLQVPSVLDEHCEG